MSTQDTCCTIAPYFKVHPGKLGDFKKLCARFIEKTEQEPGCLYYGFSFDGDEVFCREGYQDAAALLAHSENVGPLFEEALKMADLTRVEIHGPEGELVRLRTPFADLTPRFFTLECGFHR